MPKLVINKRKLIFSTLLVAFLLILSVSAYLMYQNGLFSEKDELNSNNSSSTNNEVIDLYPIEMAYIEKLDSGEWEFAGIILFFDEYIEVGEVGFISTYYLEGDVKIPMYIYAGGLKGFETVGFRPLIDPFQGMKAYQEFQYSIEDFQEHDFWEQGDKVPVLYIENTPDFEELSRCEGIYCDSLYLEVALGDWINDTASAPNININNYVIPDFIAIKML